MTLERNNGMKFSKDSDMVILSHTVISHIKDVLPVLIPSAVKREYKLYVVCGKHVIGQQLLQIRSPSISIYYLSTAIFLDNVNLLERR